MTIHPDNVLRVGLVKCRDEAQLPTQKNPGDDVGWDLVAAVTLVLQPQSVTRVPIGLKQAYAPSPPFHLHYVTPYLKIEGRSGLASKGIWPVGGIIDPGYRGEIEVALYNSSPRIPYTVNVGDRIAQLVCYYAAAVGNDAHVRFYLTKEAEPSDRGEGGFGSSGT